MPTNLRGGDAANNPVAIDTKLSLPYEGAKKVGAEIIFGYLNQMLEEGCQLSLVVEQFDETNESRGQLRFTQNLNDLEYENSAGVFTLLDDNKKNSPLDSGNWGYMRLEVDFSKTPPAYIEAQLNDTVYTAVKDLAIRVAADTTAKKTGLELHLWNAATIVEGAEYFLRFFHLYRIL